MEETEIERNGTRMKRVKGVARYENERLHACSVRVIVVKNYEFTSLSLDDGKTTLAIPLDAVEDLITTAF